ncbi:hypothetical protein AWB74_05613 [Caballeronia arvi]|uniref:Uncharacterized protein n=1 Tax=Caballeronia arvi TaxID=1777135 RepID=A0A158KGF0_9BURK|nr:hypothetical protein AWB74_05613 [Caballeronia arvi]
MVFCGFQGMVSPGISMPKSVNHVPAKSVNHVPGLYTAAKKVTPAPGRGSANRPT